MSDLISRKSVLDKLKDFSNMYTLDEEARIVLETIVRIITEQPTTYDVEKIIKNLRLTCYAMGLDEVTEAEGIDRSNININKNQIDLLLKLKALNKKIVVVLFTGSIVDLSFDVNVAKVLPFGNS